MSTVSVRYIVDVVDDVADADRAHLLAPDCSGIPARRPLVISGAGLEQLDQVARRVLEQDLPDGDAGGDLVAKAGALRAQRRDGGVEVGHSQRDPIPAARGGPG